MPVTHVEPGPGFAVQVHRLLVLAAPAQEAIALILLPGGGDAQLESALVPAPAARAKVLARLDRAELELLRGLEVDRVFDDPAAEHLQRLSGRVPQRGDAIGDLSEALRDQ